MDIFFKKVSLYVFGVFLLSAGFVHATEGARYDADCVVRVVGGA